MDEAEQLVNDISGVLGDAPNVRDLDDGETVRLDIGYLKGSRIAKDGGLTISFHFGFQLDLHDEMEEIIEPRLDKRKFKVPDDRRRAKSWDIGYVEVGQGGELVDYEVEDDYLKPTERSD